MFDVEKIRKDFPILHQQVRGKPLIFLDSGASSQKPRQVIETIDYYYRRDHANIHRGVYALSERATESFENARILVQQFINAKRSDEIIFVRGTTEAINLVAQSYGRNKIKKGDEIILSEMEHHSNIVPWQILSEQTGAILKIIKVLDNGELDFKHYQNLLSNKTKLVAITHVSNVLGTINPVKEIISLAHQKNIPVLLDGAQAVPHKLVDVQDLDCDFYAFSAHKMYGPTGIGVLYGKYELLDSMSPYQGGGDMISKVSFDKTEYNKLPYKFEAGTPHIAGVIGLGAAIQYLNEIGMQAIYDHEHELLQYATKKLKQFPNIRIIGDNSHKAAVVSFVFDDIHAHDVGTILDNEGIAVRAGHHCAMPLMARFNIPASVRASFGIYNTNQEIDVLIDSLHKVEEVFG